jgi:hypothetical protein
MAEYAGKRELNIIGKNEVTKRDPQLQQIMDLTIEKLKGTSDAVGKSSSAVAPPVLPLENQRLVRYKR